MYLRHLHSPTLTQFRVSFDIQIGTKYLCDSKASYQVCLCVCECVASAPIPCLMCGYRRRCWPAACVAGLLSSAPSSSSNKSCLVCGCRLRCRPFQLSSQILPGVRVPPALQAPKSCLVCGCRLRCRPAACVAGHSTPSRRVGAACVAGKPSGHGSSGRVWPPRCRISGRESRGG